jgi:hypothetical protein
MKPSLVFWILTPLFRKRCPDMISMGRSVKEINCFSICVDNPDGSPLLLVDSLAPPVFAGRKWNEKQYLDAHTININDVLPSQIRIRHYYGPHTIKYDGFMSTFSAALQAGRNSKLMFLDSFTARNSLSLTRKTWRQKAALIFCDF